MTREEAARILHPDTSLAALVRYEPGDERMDAVNEACRIAADALRDDHSADAGKMVPPTNADRIRAMSDEELRDFLYDYKFTEMCVEGCDQCTYGGRCEERLLNWLQQPAKED